MLVIKMGVITMYNEAKAQHAVDAIFDFCCWV